MQFLPHEPSEQTKTRLYYKLLNSSQHMLNWMFGWTWTETWKKLKLNFQLFPSFLILFFTSLHENEWETVILFFFGRGLKKIPIAKWHTRADYEEVLIASACCTGFFCSLMKGLGAADDDLLRILTDCRFIPDHRLGSV